MTTTIDNKTKEQTDKDMFIQVQAFLSIISDKVLQPQSISSEKGKALVDLTRAVS